MTFLVADADDSMGKPPFVKPEISARRQAVQVFKARRRLHENQRIKPPG